MFWQNNPVLRSAIPFGIGMAAGGVWADSLSSTPLFVGCCAALAIAVLLFPQSGNRRLRSLFGIAAAALGLLLGMALYTMKYERVAQAVPADTTFCAGILTEPPVEKARSWAVRVEQSNGARILLHIGKEINEEDTLTSGKDPSSLRPGDTLRACIRHLTSTLNRDEFAEYRKSLFHKGICATAYVPPHRWVAHPASSSLSLSVRASELQEQLHDLFSERGIDGESGAIIEAMTLGRKADLSPATRQAFANAGVSHVLALSGFHVGIIAMILQFALLCRVFPLRWRWVGNLAIIIALWIYAHITGLSPSLTRATLMFTILLTCQSFNHQLMSLNSCAITFGAMLCVNPFYLHDVGFQLSFVSVLGICLLNRPTSSAIHTRNRIFRFLWDTLTISLVCSVFTAPLVAFHFGQVPLYSLLSNLLLAPLTYVLMWGSVQWWALTPFPALQASLNEPLHICASAMSDICSWISSLPLATIEWRPSALTTLLCYAPIIALISLIYRKMRPTSRLS